MSTSIGKHRKPTLDRRKVVAAILKQRGNALVVAGLGAPCFDVMACGDNPLNLGTPLRTIVAHLITLTQVSPEILNPPLPLPP